MTQTSTNFVSLLEAAAILDCSTRTIRRRITDGSLIGYRFGPRLIRIDRAELDALAHLTVIEPAPVDIRRIEGAAS